MEFKLSIDNAIFFLLVLQVPFVDFVVGLRPAVAKLFLLFLVPFGLLGYFGGRPRRPLDVQDLLLDGLYGGRLGGHHLGADSRLGGRPRGALGVLAYFLPLDLLLALDGHLFDAVYFEDELDRREVTLVWERYFRRGSVMRVKLWSCLY